MPARRRTARARGERSIQIVRALNSDETFMVAAALRAFAVTLTEVDRTFPDPDKRTMAGRASDLADEFRTANQARDYIETRDQ